MGCGYVLLFLLDMKIENRLQIRKPVLEIAVHLVVAGDVVNDVLFCAVLFPMRCLEYDLGLN